MKITASPDGTLQLDLERIARIPVITALMEVVAQITGMGFVGVARVTDESWLACAVRDSIGFGLKPGEELELETTLCNEIRQHQKPVVIDHVSSDADYHDHPTPARYGFQSYISFPIFRKDGTFFGTLCAIDPKPHALNNPTVRGLFTLLTDLIAMHLQALEDLEQSQQELQAFNMVASHDLQEPLRKIRLFTDKALTREEGTLLEATRNDLERVSKAAGRMQTLVRAISDYPLSAGNDAATHLNLRTIIDSVRNDLWKELLERGAVLRFDGEAAVEGQPIQLRQLLYNVLQNALKFASPERQLQVRISNEVVPGNGCDRAGLVPDMRYYHIRVSDNGIGFRPEYNERVFQLFQRLHPSTDYPGSGVGLAVVRRIVEHHGGRVYATGRELQGADIDIYLPLLQPN